FFMVTAGGAQVDGTLDANGSANTDFNARWSGAAKRTADGWSATMAIPFKVLRFRASERVAMSFKLVRFISRRSEEVDFPEIVQGLGPQLTQFRKISFANIEPGLPEDGLLVDSREIFERKAQLRSQPEIASYEGRLKVWGDASVFDYLVFPSRELQPAMTPFHLASRPHASLTSRFNRLEYLLEKPVTDLDNFLQKTQTTSFIVVKDDRVLYEKYFHGYARDSV